MLAEPRRPRLLGAGIATVPLAGLRVAGLVVAGAFGTLAIALAVAAGRAELATRHRVTCLALRLVPGAALVSVILTAVTARLGAIQAFGCPLVVPVTTSGRAARSGVALLLARITDVTIIELAMASTFATGSFGTGPLGTGASRQLAVIDRLAIGARRPGRPVAVASELVA